MRVVCRDDEVAASSSGNLVVIVRTLLCPAKGDMPPSSAGTWITGRYCSLPKIAAKILQPCAVFVLNEVEKGATFSQGATVVLERACHT